MQDDDGVDEVEAERAAQPPKRKSSFGLKKDPLTQTGITSFFNAKEGGAATFKSALELSTKNNQQGRDPIRFFLFSKSA